MSFDNLLIERDGAVAILTVNRPKVLNALNTQTLDELRRAILELKRDDGVRAVAADCSWQPRRTRRASCAPRNRR